MSIMNGILNPDKFYTWGSNWQNRYSYYNLWSADNTVTGDFDQGNDNPVVKTVYDPCPAGFKIPANNAFTGFTTTGQNSSTLSDFNVDGTNDEPPYQDNFGHKFWTSSSKTATINFPASGYRHFSSGSLNSIGNYGGYWSTVPSFPYSGCYFFSFPGRVYPLFNNARSYGMAARPVSE